MTRYSTLRAACSVGNCPRRDPWREERLVSALTIGRPPEHDLRTLMDAILYVDRTGVPWRYLPHDYPHHQTVYAYFSRWHNDGVFTQLTTRRFTGGSTVTWRDT